MCFKTSFLNHDAPLMLSGSLNPGNSSSNNCFSPSITIRLKTQTKGNFLNWFPSNWTAVEEIGPLSDVFYWLRHKGVWYEIGICYLNLKCLVKCFKQQRLWNKSSHINEWVCVVLESRHFLVALTCKKNIRVSFSVTNGFFMAKKNMPINFP